MGKAAKFKKLRRLANQLPSINTRQMVGKRLSGKELMGIEKDTNGDAIDSRVTYRQVSAVTVPLNHNRKLKEAYKKAGLKGAASYANAVMAYAKSKTAAATEPASR